MRGRQMKRLLYIFNLILCLFIFTACEEEEVDNGTGSGDSSVDEFTAGIYCAISANLYMDGTIGGDSQTGLCMDEFYDSYNSATTESACNDEGAGGVWMDAVDLFCDFCATFSEDGSFVNMQGMSGTWVLEENNMTISTDASCWGHNGEIQADDEATCSEAGGDYDEAEITIATFEDGMLIVDFIPDFECYCEMEDCHDLNETACSEAGGEWMQDGPAFSIELGTATTYNECGDHGCEDFDNQEDCEGSDDCEWHDHDGDGHCVDADEHDDDDHSDDGDDDHDGNTGGGTSMYSSDDFSGTIWEETMLEFSGMLTTAQDVSVLDAWNPATGNFDIIITHEDSSQTTTSLEYLNVEVENDGYGTSLEFEISSQSDWDNMSYYDYYELEIDCHGSYNDDGCSIHYESPNFNFYSNIDENNFSWDADTYTFTMNSEYTYSDSWSGVSLTIPSGASLTAGSAMFDAGVAMEIVSDVEMVDSWETRIWEFREDGTIMTDYSTDCSLLDAYNSYDCYDNGCEVVWSQGDGMWNWGEDFVDDNGNGMWDEGESFTDQGDDVIGCQDVDCESFSSEYECYSSQACNWDWDDQACESWGDDSGPDDFTWEVVNDQMILTPGENVDEDGPQMPLILDIISMDENGAVLQLNVEMCEFYGSYYMGMIYYMYYSLYGYDFGTGNASGYYASNFSNLADNLCSYIYQDFAGDIYGLEGDQIESVNQSQTITFVPGEWPSTRGSRKTKNSIISPKLFNRMLK
tara:strand:+ start:75 stop:2318 length:2244 start_codon:yes stop_codon:yes gene_type:complete